MSSPYATDSPLAKQLRHKIRSEGPIPFNEWMAACLYDAEHGYYTQPNRQRTGRGGDFITSVSVGPIFGRALALAFFGMWEQAGRPEEFWLIEYGAEDGQLTVDILSTLEEVGGPDFAAAVRYSLSAMNAAQRQIQVKTLEDKGLSQKASWTETAKTYPVGVVFGNEVVDAQPIHLIEKTQAGWEERYVSLNAHDEFTWWTENSIGVGLGPLARLENHPVGYQTELRGLADVELLQSMSSHIERGAVLLIDYGFAERELYSPARPAGTLQCYHQHTKNDDPLAHPGEQDISCHVNFSQLVARGREFGLEPLAWVDQQRSLAGLLTAHAGNPDEPTLLRGLEDQAGGLRQLQTLMHPEALGAKFHWLWQTKGLELDSTTLPALKFATSRDLDALETI